MSKQNEKPLANHVTKSGNTPQFNYLNGMKLVGEGKAREHWHNTNKSRKHSLTVLIKKKLINHTILISRSVHTQQ